MAGHRKNQGDFIQSIGEVEGNQVVFRSGTRARRVALFANWILAILSSQNRSKLESILFANLSRYRDRYFFPT